MTGKPPIKHYDEKMEWMINHQSIGDKTQCSGCGCEFVTKPQFAHYLARTDDNLKKYPLMIDSILNASAQCPVCNLEHITQYGKEPMTNLEAQRIENYLRENPPVAEWCNNPNQREYDFNELIK